jgi:vitamin B12 transport system permease protein
MQLDSVFQQQQHRWRWAYSLAFIALCLTVVLALAMGTIWIWPWGTHSSLDATLLWQLRLPRLIAAISIGAALAVSGGVLQVLLGNPLAEPGVLGISGGASLALIGVLFFFNQSPAPWISMTAAMAGALCFTLILVGLAQRRSVTLSRLLLIGVALGILSSAGVTWAFYFSDDLSLRQLMYWLMGSVSGVTWPQLTLVIGIWPALFWLMSQGKKLDLLMLGELSAQQLGLNVQKLRWRLIFIVALLVGASVALGGIIGFVGLVVPHLLRLSLGAQNRYLMPLSAIVGGTLLAFADTLSRVILPSAELPIGVVTTTLGAPVFIYLLLRSNE